MVAPPSLGWVHDTPALALSGSAVTLVGAGGAVAGGVTAMIGATAGTPLAFRMNSM